MSYRHTTLPEALPKADRPAALPLKKRRIVLAGFAALAVSLLWYAQAHSQSIWHSRLVSTLNKNLDPSQTSNPNRVVANPATTKYDPELQLVSAIDLLRAGKMDEALATMRTLTRTEPKFQLARFLLNEIEAARRGNATDMAALQRNPRFQELIEEARLRWAYRQNPPLAGTIPDVLLHHEGNVPYVLVVDMARARMYLLQKNQTAQYVLIKDMYATIGKKGSGKTSEGDERTPVGVYALNGWMSDKELPDFYGFGAYPLDYPNTWDRLHGKTGSGIWLHGVPKDTYSRPPRASKGCVVVANEDLQTIHDILQLNRTPIIVAEKVNWLTPVQLEVEKQSVKLAIETWRGHWRGRNTEGYLSFYAPEFQQEIWSNTNNKNKIDNRNLRTFSEYKTQLFSQKTFIQMSVNDLTVYRYPSEQGGNWMYWVKFKQNYQSQDYYGTSEKEQLWRRLPSGQWQILYEIVNMPQNTACDGACDV